MDYLMVLVCSILSLSVINGASDNYTNSTMSIAPMTTIICTTINISEANATNSTSVTFTTVPSISTTSTANATASTPSATSTANATASTPSATSTANATASTPSATSTANATESTPSATSTANATESTPSTTSTANALSTAPVLSMTTNTTTPGAVTSQVLSSPAVTCTPCANNITFSFFDIDALKFNTSVTDLQYFALALILSAGLLIIVSVCFICFITCTCCCCTCKKKSEKNVYATRIEQLIGDEESEMEVIELGKTKDKKKKKNSNKKKDEWYEEKSAALEEVMAEGAAKELESVTIESHGRVRYEKVEKTIELEANVVPGEIVSSNKPEENKYETVPEVVTHDIENKQNKEEDEDTVSDYETAVDLMKKEEDAVNVYVNVESVAEVTNKEEGDGVNLYVNVDVAEVANKEEGDGVNLYVNVDVAEVANKEEGDGVNLYVNVDVAEVATKEQEDEAANDYENAAAVMENEKVQISSEADKDTSLTPIMDETPMVVKDEIPVDPHDYDIIDDSMVNPVPVQGNDIVIETDALDEMIKNMLEISDV